MFLYSEMSEYVMWKLSQHAGLFYLLIDDIIKQNRKKKWTQRQGFQQFRGRVGGKLVKGKNMGNKGVS